MTLSVCAVIALPATARTPSCFKYDPKALRIVQDGASGWRVIATNTKGWLLDTEADAKQALRIASSFSMSCRVPGMQDLGIQYWEGVGSTTLGPVTAEPDCVAYEPAKLEISKSEGQFNLVAIPRRLVAVPSADDAAVLLKVLGRYSHHCFIGRGNKRTDQLSYIFEYWR